MELKSLANIFTERILRIPDYQRGYAWHDPQWESFWEDLINLPDGKVHYTGVITLEPVPAKQSSKWDDDQWLIDGPGYSPFYVVDGQQRLTTSIILIQCILEEMPDGADLNHQTFSQIKSKYILAKNESRSLQAFLFGYETDNPSYECLKTKIFCEDSHSNDFTESLYTRNLINAKEYFSKKVAELKWSEIEALFSKLTQKFRFNLYKINEEIDVFVTFETMNNRGKPLSNLELLKNRLIYLSTLYDGHDAKDLLRSKINSAWKTIYEYLGKNPDAPLPDDEFLKNHWTMFFKYSRKKGDDYIKWLLNEKFTAKNILYPKHPKNTLPLEEIEQYVTNLQKAARLWFYIHNPYIHLNGFDNEKNKSLLDRLHRIGFKAFKPLLLACYLRKESFENINQLIEAAERYNFIVFSLSRRRANTGDSEFYRQAKDILDGEIQLKELIETINLQADSYFDPDQFYNYIRDLYKTGRQGFYHWDGLRYCLFEYEQDLYNKGRNSSKKIDWQSFNDKEKDQVTIEHIYPQTPDDEYWSSRFSEFSEEYNNYLTHAIGNLVPLSRAKNSKFQNFNFDIKKNNGNGVGFYNGSAAENEIALENEWTAGKIIKRSLLLMEFIEKRWEIDFGGREKKLQILHLTNNA